MNRARTAAAALAAAGILSATAACSGSAQKPPSPTATASATTGTTAATLPATPPGAQARWLLGAIAHPPIPAAAITAHFDQVFLTKIPAAQLNATFARVGTLRPDAVLASTSEFVTLAVSLNGQPETVTLSVDAHGLINGLRLAAEPSQPALPVPTTWAGVDKQVQQAAPQTRLLVARVTGGGCQTVHAVDATTPAPLGSAFKLYVLDALARAIAAGTVSWDQRLTLTSQLTSLPSGDLCDRTRRHPGDGTAGRRGHDLEQRQHRRRPADHAGRPDGRRVGRGRLGHGGPRPGHAVPHHQGAVRPQARRLARPRQPLPRARRRGPAGACSPAPSTASRSARFTSRPRPGGPSRATSAPSSGSPRRPTSAASTRRSPRCPASPGWPRWRASSRSTTAAWPSTQRQWSSVWFKGGSEPGVVTLNYLATTRTGQSYVVSALAANPSAPIPQTAAAQLLGAIKAAFTLAAG